MQVGVAFRSKLSPIHRYFFSNINCPLCPTTRRTAWAKRAKSQGSVTFIRGHPSLLRELPYMRELGAETC